MSESKDAWSKTQVVTSALGAIVMPIVLLLIGHWFTEQQEKNAEATRQVERLTALLKPLGSESVRERRLAVEVAGYLAKTKQLPLELVPALVDIVQSDPASSNAQAAATALDQVSKANPNLGQQIQSNLKDLPARIYIHIADESQRSDARGLASKIQDAMKQDEPVIPGIQRAQGPTKSEIRYFKRADRAEAEKIAKTIEGLGYHVIVRDLSNRYESSESIRPRHFELWLAGDFLKH